jgi:tubulin epsilon
LDGIKIRFDTCVFPSDDDDVVMSPYNSVLALNMLTEHADCVLPIENQSLIDIVNKVKGPSSSSRSEGETVGKITDNAAGVASKSAKRKAFDSMNNIAANLLTNLTSSMRFEGSLNVDLNEITTNLVPYPKLHYIMSSLSPLSFSQDLQKRKVPRSVDNMFSDAFHRDHYLIKADPKNSTYLACGLLLRGDVEISDINRNIQRLKPDLKMPYWNSEGFKIGLCSVPPLGQPYSLLTLSNNCSIRHTFARMKEKFDLLYKRKVLEGPSLFYYFPSMV